jgi:microcompartment protein CcmL/EutN
MKPKEDSRNKINWRRNPKMNSKVEVPRLQETTKYLWPNSPNQTKMELNMESFKRDERRNMEKSENKKFKLDVKSLWLQQHMKVTKKTPQEALILNHGKETLEEDGPREEDKPRGGEERRKRRRR